MMITVSALRALTVPSLLSNGQVTHGNTTTALPLVMIGRGHLYFTPEKLTIANVRRTTRLALRLFSLQSISKLPYSLSSPIFPAPPPLQLFCNTVATRDTTRDRNRVYKKFLNSYCVFLFAIPLSSPSSLAILWYSTSRPTSCTILICHKKFSALTYPSCLHRALVMAAP